MEGCASARAESRSINLIYRLSCFGAFAATFCCTAACAAPVAIPSNVIVGRALPRALPEAPYARPDDAPRIVRIWFSTLTLQPGTWFDGLIVGGSNLASVEVRTAAFSINSQHVAPGVYRFHMRVLELPPLSRRHSYELSIIGRNTAGVQTVELAPLRIE